MTMCLFCVFVDCVELEFLYGIGAGFLVKLKIKYFLNRKKLLIVQNVNEKRELICFSIMFFSSYCRSCVKPEFSQD